ncbi:MAG: hypothetical protein MUF71_19640 [Candidatus Kapabacteria bacterium]|jgi:hypothetical protein|nr:hypothetical protein [Candidatus Kapabacteria bacterium]
MDVNNELQEQLDKIHSFFKYTTEPYDYWDWDGESLIVVLNDEVIEEYTFQDLRDFEVLD